jgi:hypothetical protein
MTDELPAQQCCATCRHWFERDDLPAYFQVASSVGLCTRHAPRPGKCKDSDDDMPNLAKWPATYDIDLCGEWQQQDAQNVSSVLA